MQANLTLKDLKTILKTLFICDNCIHSSSFSQVCSTYILYLTLPVSVASAKILFSKLKLTKSYLQRSMSEFRLCCWQFWVQRKVTETIDFNQLIDNFACLHQLNKENCNQWCFSFILKFVFSLSVCYSILIKIL